MLLTQSLLWLLVNDTSHISTWVVICDHVKVVEGLERVVQFSHEAVIDLALNFFLSDHESREAIIRALLHTLHSIEESSAFPGWT